MSINLFYYSIPENLDLKQLLVRYSPSFKFNIHKAHLFLSKLSELTFNERFVTRNGFVQMSSRMILIESAQSVPSKY